ITATQNPDQTEEVRIITATPLPGTPGVVALPTGLIESLDATTAAAAPTINPTLIGADAGLQGTATALPPNCILHTVAEGDTPFGIAEEYGADGTQLMEVNGLTEETASLMQIGDVLIVPLEGCPLTAADVVQVEDATEIPPEDLETATPAGSPTEAPTATPTPSQVPSATLPPTATNAQVEIVRVLSAGDINAEGVDVRNNGAVVDLTGWKLSNSAGVSYTFPQQRLFTGSVLTVYTRVGTDTPTAKFWGRDTALWSPGATLTLTDAGGRVQSTFIVQ
ncbi:MAG: lamin tail domain-containing protein, partial [Anaerolineae bacterium]|nr:lamin tail domain-containing protein [Anaerolineae bacterium]